MLLFSGTILLTKQGVWKNHLHSFHLCHNDKQHNFCIWSCHWCTHQRKSQIGWALLNKCRNTLNSNWQTMQPWYLVEPQPISCANEKTTNFYFFWLLSSFFTTILCKNVFRWSSNSIAVVVWSPKDLLQVNFFSVLDPPLKTLLLFLSFSMNKLNQSETKNWKFFSFHWSLSVNFPTDFNLSLTQFFCKKKKFKVVIILTFLSSFKIYFFEDKVKNGFQSVVK